jgi:hypothetical protein
MSGPDSSVDRVNATAAAPSVHRAKDTLAGVNNHAMVERWLGDRRQWLNEGSAKRSSASNDAGRDPATDGLIR